DHRTSGLWQMRLCRAAIVGKRTEHWVDRRRAVAYLISVVAIDEAGAAEPITNKVVASRRERAKHVRVRCAGISCDDRVSHADGAKVKNAATFVKATAADRIQCERAIDNGQVAKVVNAAALVEGAVAARKIARECAVGDARCAGADIDAATLVVEGVTAR